MSRNIRRNTPWSALVAATTAIAAVSLGMAIPAAAVSTNFTFESDNIGSVPVGCATPANRTAASVSATQHYEGSHSLRVYDSSASSITAANCTSSPRQGGYLSFEVYPAAIPNGFTFNVNGTAQGTDRPGRTRREESRCGGGRPGCCASLRGRSYGCARAGRSSVCRKGGRAGGTRSGQGRPG